MPLTLSDMFTPVTKDQALQSMLDIAEQLEFPIEAQAWQSGGVAREILEVIAQKIADLSQVTTAIAAGGLLDFSRGGWLTLLAKSAYGVTRIPSTFGTGSELLTNNSVTTYVISPGDLIFLNSTTGSTYTNTDGGTLTSGGGTLTLAIIANEAGTDSNASAGQIDALVTPLLDVVVTNPAALSATDEELDEPLKARCREKLAAASPNGAADAYNFFAKSATRQADGSNVGITRVKTSQSAGNVVVYVANATGPVSGTAGDPTTDLGAVNLVIQTSCVPTGITATVVSAAEHDILVEADVWLRPGSSLTTAIVRQLILDRLEGYFDSVPIGGFDIGGGGMIFLPAVTGQIFQAHPDIIEVVITAPLVDEAIAANEVTVLTSIDTSFIIHTT